MIPSSNLFRVASFCTVILFGFPAAWPSHAFSDPATPLKLALVIPAESREGTEILNGAQLAIEEAEAAGRMVHLTVLPAAMTWDRQTGELSRAIYEKEIGIVIGAPSATSAHLVAQVVTRAKGSVLFLSLSADPTLTQIGVPWIYRAVPRGRGPEDILDCSDTAFCERFREKYGSSPGFLAAYAYDAVQVSLSVDPDELELRNRVYLGATGQFEFDEKRNRIELR